jgi:hypothetical protein
LAVPYFLSAKEKAALPAHLLSVVRQQQAAINCALDHLQSAVCPSFLAPSQLELINQSTGKDLENLVSDSDVSVGVLQREPSSHQNNVIFANTHGISSEHKTVLCKRMSAVSVTESVPQFNISGQLKSVCEKYKKEKDFTVGEQRKSHSEKDHDVITCREDEKHENVSVKSSDLLCISRNRFEWAWFTVNTRAVYLAADPRDRDHRFGQQSAADSLALVPFLDLLNHSGSVAVQAGINIHNSGDRKVYFEQ